MDLTVGILQLNSTVGALQANATKIIEGYQRVVEAGADIVLTPEMALCGYPIDDLVVDESYASRVQEALSLIAAEVGQAPLVLGTALASTADSIIQNVAIVLQNKKIVQQTAKIALPDYGLFDDSRNFVPGNEIATITCKGAKIGLLICEDMWQQEVASTIPSCDVLFNLSASPYTQSKLHERTQVGYRALQHATAHSLVYANLFGGQDDWVFDGRSFVMTGNSICLADAEAQQLLVRLDSNNCSEMLILDGSQCTPVPNQSIETIRKQEHREHNYELLWHLLVHCTRDYITKAGFSHVVLGMSGGIDSAVVGAICSEAIGAENVFCISLPSEYNSDATKTDARLQSESLGCTFEEIPIGAINASARRALDGILDSTWSLADENLQSRLRGTLLMAVSNKQNRLLITTGNKSELAMGYATLYGDMNGAYAPLKDLYKTEVFKLAEARNRRATLEGQPSVILTSIIERPPSAELRPDQRDDQSLPPYDQLDEFLRNHIEKQLAPASCTSNAISRERAIQLARQIRINEYKRRQAPPGPSVSHFAFGRERRYPIINQLEDA